MDVYTRNRHLLITPVIVSVKGVRKKKEPRTDTDAHGPVLPLERPKAIFREALLRIRRRTALAKGKARPCASASVRGANSSPRRSDAAPAAL